ncbi:MAG: 4-hydroxythreonine-4-phosphate dehydrogenase PdxA [Ignavibacteria bacterium]|nr:4-hydroxythreonine-4-phosphate dehydrogenase PdxA [Ignavibacteria bacterium]
MLPVIALSIGDMYGIGPEVLIKAFTRSDLFSVCRPVVYGPASVLEWHRARQGAAVELRAIAEAADAPEGCLGIVDAGGAFDPARVGSIDADAGRTSIDAIVAALAAVREGAAEALVTAPVSKEAMALAGSPYKGHTDMLAALCGAGDVIMILAGNTMKVGLVTIHVPVREVGGMITRERVLSTIRSGHRALTLDFAIAKPRLAVLALNPHAGDGGHIGHEEEDAVIPALRDARDEGIRAEGPFAADGFFSAHNRELYDMIIAMYHDQGLIPFKMQAGGRGVNISSGLPIVRTSPDHGTAFDIAGKGVASAESMKEAILTARTIAMNRRAARGGAA